MSVPDPLGVAVVGTGRIARAWHLPEWARRVDARLLWTVDVDEDAARAAAVSWDVPRWTTDLAPVLEDPGVSVVDVCTPAEAHAEPVCAALAAGRHVLVEKPAAGSLAEVRAMADAADASGAVAMVAENWLFSPGVARLRQLIADGALGELVSVLATLETGIDLDSAADRRSRLLNGGVHAVNVIRHLVGEPTHVGAFALPDRASALTGPDADTDLVVSFRFGGTGIGGLHMSGRAQRPRPGAKRVRVLGTKGMAETDIAAGWIEWTGAAWSGGPTHRWHDSGASQGQAEEIDHFVAAVRGSVEPMPSLRDQVRTHQVLDAIQCSARDLATVAVGRS